jgi:Gnt-I system high-affinity gluconate transporter
MPILIVVFGIIVLLLLIMGLRVNAFLALILVALGVGVAEGMPLLDVVQSIQAGVGNTLGSLALILGFGAMLGAMVAESGAARQITDRLVRRFGLKHIQWALVLTGFIVGVPLFYSVGFVMLIPVIFAIANATNLPLLYVGIPMVASLSVTHGFLPPHPAPTAISVIYQADISLVLLYGVILAIPTIIIAGPIFGGALRHMESKPRQDLFRQIEPPSRPPSFAVSVATALIPVVLMGLAAIAKLFFPAEGILAQTFSFLGDPVIALLLALLIAIYTLGLRTGRTMKDIMDGLVESVKAIAMILLIIGAGGAFSQVLRDSGVGDYIAEAMRHTKMSPLLLAWLIAATLRIALGSATVAALTAAGIAAPMIGATSVNPELLVLATGAGSLTCSQVNDTGFWLFKEYFNLSIIDTLKTWTVMETIISLVGLAGCLVMDWFL